MPIYRKYFTTCIILLLISLYTFGSKNDSLKVVYQECQSVMSSDPDSAFHIAQRAIENLSRKEEMYPFFLIQIADFHRVSGNYDSSYVKYHEALRLFEKVNNTPMIAEIKLNIGILYDLQKDPQSAIKQYKYAIKDFNKINNSEGLIKAYMNLGISFKNIGLNTNSSSMLDSAFYYYNKAEDILSEQNNPLGLTKLYINIGNLKYTTQNFVEAIFYYKKALKIAEPNNYNQELALIFDNLGWAYQQLNDNETALVYSMEGLKIARKINSKYNTVNSLSNISRIYYNLKNYKEAYNYMDRMVMLNDSLISENTIELQNKLQTKYESEKKDNEIALLNAEKDKNAAIALAEKKKKNTIIISIGLGLFLVLVFSFFLYQRYRVTQRQKGIIDQKNKDITDSINYAKKIQTALLKEEEHVSKNLPPHFIFFQPKDIVSGDFYWTHQRQDNLYLAVADCTGHGVPGAFLTMLGTAFLNEITSKEKTFSPAEILDELREKFINELGQTGEQGVNKDGMDISLIKLNLMNNVLEWAGANNPLWIVTNQDCLIEKYKSDRDISFNNKTLISVAPNKQPIGHFRKMTPFTNHTIPLQKQDVLFIFSDGYPDQFGGDHGKKLMYAPFKKLLLENAHKPMEDQKNIVKEAFFDWKGKYEQIDDVCIIGVRI